MKELYRFKVYQDTEVELEEETEVNGEIVKITRKVKTQLPVNFVVKKPSRSEIEEIEFEYDKEFHRLTSAGILPRAMMEKQYLQLGGVLTDGEKKTRKEVAQELSAKIDEFERLSTSEIKDENKLKELGQEILDGQAALQTFHSIEESLFNNCAETKARNKTVNYLLANFCYVDPSTPEKPNQKPYLFFKGDTVEEKLDDRSEKVEAGDAFNLEAIEFFTFFIGLWYYNRANTAEEFKKHEENYRKSRNDNQGVDPGPAE